AEYIGKSTFLVQKNKKWGAYFAGNIVDNDLAEQEKLVIPCKYEDLEAMAENSVIKFKEKEKYGLYFYNGIRLLSPEFDDIARFRNDTLLITKDGEKGFYTPQQLLEWYRSKAKKLPLPLKDYTLSHKVFLKVKYGDSYGISLLNGKELIKTDKKQVIESKIGWTVAEFDGGWNLYDFSGKLITTEPVQTMQIALPYILFKKNNKWGMMTTQGEEVLPAEYDKITAKKNYFVVEKKKKNYLWFHSSKPLVDTSPFLKYEVAVTLLPTNEIKQGYIIFQDKKTKKFGMLNTDAKTLVAAKQEQLNFIQDDILLFTQKKLKGLMNNEGKIILSAKYEKIAALAPQQFSLFAKKKFGIFIANKNFLVEPQSLTIIIAFGQSNFDLYTTKANKKQFTDKKGQPKTKEIFDNIQHWTDSLALVKTGRYWRLYDLVNQKFTVDEFKEYDIFFDTPYEKIA
ncbi:MAG: WG repeat-containing protein, partial [Thermoflexibacteraceae bacterium]